jgi:hypothetical protein
MMTYPVERNVVLGASIESLGGANNQEASNCGVTQSRENVNHFEV